MLLKMKKIIVCLTLGAFLFLGVHTLSHASAMRHQDAACSVCQVISQTPTLSGHSVPLPLPVFSAHTLFVVVDFVFQPALFSARTLRSPPVL